MISTFSKIFQKFTGGNAPLPLQTPMCTGTLNDMGPIQTSSGDDRWVLINSFRSEQALVPQVLNTGITR